MEATYGHAFPIGIGVHYGEAVIGTLGSSSKERLTAIGDTVNVASRGARSDTLSRNSCSRNVE